jgi:hypothetical protein
MSKKQHDGKRSPRSKRAFRIPDLGYYLILTDTNETELNYFQGIRDSLPKDLQNRLVIKVLPKIETKNLVSRCLEELDNNAQYRIPWIVFDRNEVKGFDTIINEAKKNHIHTGWSNPCFEIWLHEYLEKAPLSMDSVGCCHTFSTTFKKISKQEYDKADTSIYTKLKSYGDEDKAIQRSKQKHGAAERNNKMTSPSSQYSVNTVYMLVEEILSKAATT